MFEQINALYASIAEFESGGGRFRPDLFVERYRGVLGLFAGLDTDDRLAEADRSLHQAVTADDPTRSGLRYLTSHLLSIDFEFQANRGRPHRLAFNECVSRRRQKMNDGEFIRSHLVPIIFEPKSLGEEHGLRWLLLEHIATLSNMDPTDAWPDFLPEKQVERAAVSECLFQLMRRRLLNPDVALHLRPQTLEQNLKSSGFFGRLAAANEIHRALLLRFGYVIEKEWKEKVRRAAGEAAKDLRKEKPEAAPVQHTTKGGGAHIIWSVLSVIGLLAVLAIWTMIHGQIAGRMHEQAEVQKAKLARSLSEEAPR